MMYVHSLIYAMKLRRALRYNVLVQSNKFTLSNGGTHSCNYSKGDGREGAAFKMQLTIYINNLQNHLTTSHISLYLDKNPSK